MITDTMTITELSRLTNKSRPTIYKWLTLYKSGKAQELPSAIQELFDIIEHTRSKKEAYAFCEKMFCNEQEDGCLKEIFDLLRENRDKLDLNKIKNYIMEELK